MRLLRFAAAALLLPGAAVLATANPASAATTWTVSGPSAGTAAQVSLDNGSLTFAVSNGGQTVLSSSPIGIVTTAADLTRNLTFTQRADRTVTESYTMTTGKQRARSTTYNETTLSFTGTGGARLDVVARASNTGAAYRYVLPGSGSVTVSREASSWTVPAASNAWLVPPQAEDQGRWFATTAGGAPAGNNYRIPIVFESGWQHLADNPQSYEAHPEALRILDQLPTAWDETRLLGGRPGQEAYFARRSGSRWFIGGISALNAKTFTSPLSFLGGGQWFVETVRDGSSGLLRETRVVANADTLSVPVATRGSCNGGANQRWSRT